MPLQFAGDFYPAYRDATPSFSKDICPNPPEWAKLHSAALAAVTNGETFPKPLIPAGWAFFPDEEKGQRLADTVGWLQERGLEHLIESEVGGGWYRG
jgi:hypothetical protein